MIAPAAEADVELPGMVELRTRSAQLYPEFVARIESASRWRCGFQREPTLLVALDADHEAELERLHVIMTEQGFGVRRLLAEEALQLEPHLASRVRSAMLLEQDSRVDPRRLLRALPVALESHGGAIVRQAVVQRIDANGSVHGRRGEASFTLQAQHVVLAAGSWSNVDIESPCAALPLRPVKGQLVRLQGAPLLGRVVRTPDVYIVPREPGEIVIGATVEEQGFDPAPTAGAVLDLLRHAWRALPGIYELQLAEVAVGFRPACRDHRPVLGRWGDTRLYLATGHYRNGILLAPITARLLADLVLEARAHPLLQHFAPARFAPWSTPRATQELSS
jgi:glycine oxidase